MSGGRANKLLDRRFTDQGLLQPVLEHRAHALADGGAADERRVRVFGDHRTDFGIDLEQFTNANPPAVPGAAAARAPAAAGKPDVVRLAPRSCHEAALLECGK